VEGIAKTNKERSVRNMVKEKDKKTPVAQPAPEHVAPMYTQEDMDYREDLMKKLMTLEHVKGILIAREDAPVFVNQIEDLKGIVMGWYSKAVNSQSAGGVPQEPQGDEPADGPGTGDEPDSQ
jgi:hypothetical protein